MAFADEGIRWYSKPSAISLSTHYRHADSYCAPGAQRKMGFVDGSSRRREPARLQSTTILISLRPRHARDACAGAEAWPRQRRGASPLDAEARDARCLRFAAERNASWNRTCCKNRRNKSNNSEKQKRPTQRHTAHTRPARPAHAARTPIAAPDHTAPTGTPARRARSPLAADAADTIRGRTPRRARTRPATVTEHHVHTRHRSGAVFNGGSPPSTTLVTRR